MRLFERSEIYKEVDSRFHIDTRLPIRYGQVLKSRVIVMWESVEDNPVFRGLFIKPRQGGIELVSLCPSAAIEC